jgi:hypothetical protein
MHHLFSHAIGVSLKWISTASNGKFCLEHAAHCLVADRLL